MYSSSPHGKTQFQMLFVIMIYIVLLDKKGPFRIEREISSVNANDYILKIDINTFSSFA